MRTREEILEFINSELNSTDGITDFSELDSLAKLDLIMKCEGEFFIGIDENEVGEEGWTTDMFVDYVMDKINEMKNDIS